ncbi:chymotrypsin-1 [Drosophila bipectinata]|uniref:chymotrypsin-1 n=1 Tax=Drosophila bipectinata TaxID=42026 RepID=UPI001C89F316|nr:chymotrypsin-1 [Drosophila bipectinata]
MIRVLLVALILFQPETLARESKIFGGETKSVENYPYLVNIRRGGAFRCGGALISPSCVLTAAHCLEGRPDSLRDLSVHALQQCLSDEPAPEHVRQAWYARVSPDYMPSRGLDADVAVIRLSRPFDIAGRASFLKIDYNDLPRHVNLTIMGWGMTQEHFQNWNQCLQVAEIQKLPQRECIHRIATPQYPVTENMFCALGENATDACQGDSGGPAVSDGRIAGLVSWGYGCGRGHPGIYTRLSSPRISFWLKYFVAGHCWG